MQFASRTSDPSLPLPLSPHLYPYLYLLSQPTSLHPPAPRRRCASLHASGPSFPRFVALCPHPPPPPAAAPFHWRRRPACLVAAHPGFGSAGTPRAPFVERLPGAGGPDGPPRPPVAIYATHPAPPLQRRRAAHGRTAARPRPLLWPARQLRPRTASQYKKYIRGRVFPAPTLNPWGPGGEHSPSRPPPPPPRHLSPETNPARWRQNVTQTAPKRARQQHQLNEIRRGKGGTREQEGQAARSSEGSVRRSAPLGPNQKHDPGGTGGSRAKRLLDASVPKQGVGGLPRGMACGASPCITEGEGAGLFGPRVVPEIG
ncbi:MAG: hypothetical protein J3K34DRAFT_77941 [Monoraphidium minutum]|nr:MAG: hypothetical protein J3K34DRAFT_77941 [Monoraphidium minutum]